MNDSQNTFVQSLRERLSSVVEEPAIDSTGIVVEEHEFEDLDENTQTAVSQMFDTMRLRKEQLTDPDAFSTVRVKTLGQI